MNTEFKKISSSNNQTVYVLEDASSGGPSAGSIATMSKPLGGVRKRGQNLIAQEGNKDKVDATKPRNFVAKNAKMGGAGAHKDQKKAAKKGDVKHKNKEMDMAEGLNEFAQNKDGREEGPGDDPYKYPKPEHYSRSGDFFEKFEADHFDHEDFDDATGTFKGYWGNTQIAYFKFDNPQRTDSEDPGMGWYYEPQIEGVAEATGDERFDTMMGQIIGGAGARQGVDSLNKSLTARTGSNPESALAKWGQEFIKWLEDICRNMAKQGVDRFSKLKKLSEFEDGGETMAYWLIEVAKQTKTTGITVADIQEFSSNFNTYGMWAWQMFPIAWSQNEWQDYKDQWTGPNGYIANLRQGVAEEWSQKYKSSINCSHPRGFSQRAHCQGKKKHEESMTTMEAVCPDCGMCQTHGNLSEIKKGAKDANGFTRCWPGKHAVGTKKGKNGGQVRNCEPNEGVAEGSNKQLKEARRVAGVMTNPQAKTIKDPATGEFIPANDFFTKYPDENKQAWETALADLFDPAKAKADAAAYAAHFNDVSWMTPEEQAQYNQLYAKDRAAMQTTNIKTYGSERYLKQLFQQKMDAKKAAAMLKVHWAPLKQLESFLQGKVNNKIELSAYLAPNNESLGKTRWGGGSNPTVGIVLDGHITIGGRGDLGSDQYKMTAGQRGQQKYSSRAGQIDPTLSMDTSVHHEVLVDNWKIKEIVLPADIPPEIDRLVQQYKIPVRRVDNPQGVAEQGYGNHPSQRVDPRTGKKYVPPKSPLGQGVSEDHSTATGGWGQGAYASASTSSKWNGAGRDDSVHENPDWYNDEANGMTTSQLKSLIKHAAKLRRAVKAMQAQGDTLEPWQQAKVTKAADYLDAVFTAVDDDYDMGEEEMAEVAPKGREPTVKAMKKHKEIDNPWALANWMKNKGYKSHQKEDAYVQELFDKLGEKLDPNAPVDVWVNDFQKADPNKYHQFKNKTPEKKTQMAQAASYAAKNPDKK